MTGSKEAVTPLMQCAAGSHVPETGIYEIIHRDHHRDAHTVILVRGHQFPDCRSCGEDVRFRLLRTVPYIFHDEDFAPE